ncbi:tryptophan--tRNA ligase [bacterium]|nr:tryptophan--tRNA ligase [bacterium]
MKRKILSGIQPTSQITLGNFLGAIKLFKQFEEDDLFIFVADLHALSSNNYDPKNMQQNIMNVLKVYYAAGLDFDKTKIFIQSKVKAHTEIFNALLNFTTIGELKRMTQFKDKSQKFKLSNGTETIPTSLLTYPVLMAGDILLYDAQLVPVGIDQKQHVELTRDIAIRINNKFKTNIFSIPEPFFAKTATKIYDLINPKIKMSKSNANVNGTIFITDDIEITRKKIMSAMTDNFNKVNHDYINQPGITNLINIASSILDKDVLEILNRTKDMNYKEFKNYIADIVCSFISKLQEKMKEINEEELLKKVNNNNQICNEIADKKLLEFYKLIGIR